MNSIKKNETSKNAKKEDGKFSSKKIKHDPQAEGARAKVGLHSATPQEK